MASLQPLPVTGYSMLHALGGSRAEILSALEQGRSGLVPPADDLLCEPLGFDTAVGVVTTALPELPAPLASYSTRLARMALHLINGLEQPLARAREHMSFIVATFALMTLAVAGLWLATGARVRGALACGDRSVCSRGCRPTAVRLGTPRPRAVVPRRTGHVETCSA